MKHSIRYKIPCNSGSVGMNEMAYKLGPNDLGVEGTFPLLTITSKFPGPAFVASTKVPKELT